MAGYTDPKFPADTRDNTGEADIFPGYSHLNKSPENNDYQMPEYPPFYCVEPSISF
jgi:hypothetical protein